MAQGARAGEVERARREGVGEVVADGGWAVVLALVGWVWRGVGGVGWEVEGRIGDVLMRGSWPEPFLERFCRRDVDENGDVVAGILCRRHCGVRWKADGMRFDVVKGRKTGRKFERFIVDGGSGQWRDARCWWWWWTFRDGNRDGPLSAKTTSINGGG